MKQLAENLWIKTFPLSVLGTDHGRTVTVIRLAGGRTIVHSMAPFSPADLAEIRSLGEPAWLVESMLLHDTYAAEGRKAFPEIPFYGPEGFGEIVKFETLSLRHPPTEWAGEIEVVELHGAPRLKEHAVIHKPSRTLIVADLIFNFRQDEKGWNRIFHRYIAGFRRYPGMSRVFKICITDKAAFRASLEKLLEKDFDRIIVGHGNVIPANGKELLRRAMTDAGLL